MTSRRSYKQNYDGVAQVCTEWWRGLYGLDIETGEEDKPPKPPNRAAISKLRRIGTVTVEGREEMDTAAELGHYAALYARLKSYQSSRDQDDFAQAVAVVAGTLARVRNEADGKTARLLGAQIEEKKRLMNEERFKRLVRTRDWAELHARGRRIVHLLGPTPVPVGDLGASLFLWFAGPNVIREWSLAYYDLDEAPASLSAATSPSTANP